MGDDSDWLGPKDQHKLALWKAVGSCKSAVAGWLAVMLAE